MSDVVSWGEPLPHDQVAERVTESGILLPEPDPQKGHPIVVAQTNITGLVYNFAGPTQQHLEEIAAAIVVAQRAMLEGREWPQLWFREPQYGQDFALTPTGLQTIVGVCRGYAPLVDALELERARRAMQQAAAGGEILVPNRAARRHPVN